MNVHSFIFAVVMRIKDEVKEQIIRQKALEMLVKVGFQGFSMQKLAKEAGVSPATIYIYFKDKDDLIMALCNEAKERMAEVTLENFDASMPFAKGLKIQWQNRLKYCLEYPEQMQFWEQMRNSPEQEKLMGVVDEKFKNTLNQFTKNAVARKELVNVPLEVYWSVAFAPLYILIKFHTSGQSIGGGKFKLTDKLMNEALELVIKALTPGASN